MHCKLCALLSIAIQITFGLVASKFVQAASVLCAQANSALCLQ